MCFSLKFQLFGVFCLVLFFLLVFFPGRGFCLLLFSGLNSCPGRTPNELRTNFGLMFFRDFCFPGVELFGFGRAKTLELQLVDAFSYKFSATRATNNIETCLIQVFHANKSYFIRPKSGKPLQKSGQILKFRC